MEFFEALWRTLYLVIMDDGVQGDPECSYLEDGLHQPRELHRVGRDDGAGVALQLVLQKGPSEANPKVRNHGEGPY